MRTTVNISDDLLERAKLLAATSRKSLGEVIDDALRIVLANAERSQGRRRVTLEADGGSGLQPGVDLEDKEALAELLDDNRLPGAAG